MKFENLLLLGAVGLVIWHFVRKGKPKGNCQEDIAWATEQWEKSGMVSSMQVVFMVCPYTKETIQISHPGIAGILERKKGWKSGVEAQKQAKGFAKSLIGKPVDTAQNMIQDAGYFGCFMGTPNLKVELGGECITEIFNYKRIQYSADVNMIVNKANAG